MNYVRVVIIVTVGLAVGAANAQASAIYDASVLLSLPHTLIDFETNGTGVELYLEENGVLAMPPQEYLAKGITFDEPGIYWTNDGSADFDAAQAEGGSLDIAIPGGNSNDFVMNFLTPTRAFGFWVVDNTVSPIVPTFEARDTSGGYIETVTFAGPAIDGTIGYADYGFLGIMTAVDIGSVRITKDFAIFDELMFSPVPEPASVACLALGALVTVRRRR